MKSSRRFWIFLILALTVVLAAFLLLRPSPAPPIRIGVLHSLTGTMAISEKPLVDAVRLAVEEINAAGGVLGRQVEIVVADGKSDAVIFAAEAERLITAEKVSALFACWTSSCRKAVKPVVEKHRHLMFYPVQYEGLEQSPNIYYLGSAPNQQIIPGAQWTTNTLGKRVYLLGSDYIFPHAANIIIRDIVTANNGTVLAERYQTMGNRNFTDIVAELRKLKPDVVFNTINGDSNIAFFHALHEAGLEQLPIVSFSVDESTLQAIGTENFHPNHYAVWNYFQSLPGEANQRFVAAFKKRFGADRVTGDPIESAYTGIHLWAQAVHYVGTDMPGPVNRAMLQQSLASPSGITAIDRGTHHLWKRALVGKARADGQFELVWDFVDTLRPRPFPDYRSRSEWEQLIEDMTVNKP